MAEAELRYGLAPFPNETLRARILEMARRVAVPEAYLRGLAADRDALITGIGLISCLGEGPAATWAALDAPGGFQPVLDTARFAPFPVHPMVPLELERQIPRRVSSGKWRHGSGSGCMPPAWRWTPPG